MSRRKSRSQSVPMDRLRVNVNRSKQPEVEYQDGEQTVSEDGGMEIPNVGGGTSVEQPTYQKNLSGARRDKNRAFGQGADGIPNTNMGLSPSPTTDFKTLEKGGPASPYGVSATSNRQGKPRSFAGLQTTGEGIMPSFVDKLDNAIMEYEAKFAGGNYHPGDVKMKPVTGKGVQPKSHETVQGMDMNVETDLDEMGLDWGEQQELKDTDTMGAASRSGKLSSKAHHSSHAEANDTFQSKVGHNWPEQPKNKGGHIARFPGSRWADGGVLESWDPKAAAVLMEDGFDMVALFNTYAANRDQLRLEDFRTLCSAHGSRRVVDEGTFLRLMDQHPRFVFEEVEDGLWLRRTVTEAPEHGLQTVGSGQSFDLNPGDLNMLRAEAHSLRKLPTRTPQQTARLRSLEEQIQHAEGNVMKQG